MALGPFFGVFRAYVSCGAKRRREKWKQRERRAISRERDASNCDDQLAWQYCHSEL